MKPRGVSLIELSLAFFLVIIATLVFLTIFSSSSRQSMQSRNRTVAVILANSIMDEIEAHPYGAPEPPAWTAPVDQPVQVWVEGQPQNMDFHKQLKYSNGSFIGKASNDTDEVTITISWREGVGDSQPGVVDSGDNKILTVRTPVWK